MKKTLRAALALALLLFIQHGLRSDEAERPSDLDARLARLAGILEEKRVSMRIPGMAIAVVLNDEVVLARGFGLADREKSTPVTPETLFAVGSTTKAFTATLIGMLVDEGKMEWDDPVRRHLPYFDPAVDGGDDSTAVTIRDALSHRTGFTRMGLLFASGAVPREQILRTAAGAEPWDRFRKKFHYCNVMYLAAGEAAAAAAGMDWDTMLAEKILKPLGMKSTNTSVQLSMTDKRLSLGYIWEEDRNDFRRLDMRVLDNIAPAGAINSNVVDMARWVRFQLGRGEIEGKRLISEAQHGETWKRQISIEGGVGYGMGWMVRDWQGRPVLEHGGNIDGFGAQVALLPGSNLGFVLLTNVTATPLQQDSMNIVWETLLGESEEEGALTVRPDFDPYVGKYTANFGPFNDEKMTVKVQAGCLALDIPRQRVVELEPPDEEGKWYFTITNQIAVSFDRDGEGKVVAMKLHQGGYTFLLPRVGVEIEPEIPLSELDKYLGFFNSEQMDETVELMIKNNCLALRIPGQKTYELRAPDEEGRWYFRVIGLIALSFHETETGEIDSMTYYEGGGTIEYKRVAGEKREALPTVEEILELRQSERLEAALAEVSPFRLSGTVRFLQSGLEGRITWTGAGMDCHRQEFDLGPFGRLCFVVNREKAWSVFPMGRTDELRGVHHDQAAGGHPAALFSDWSSFFDSVRVVRMEEDEGRKICVLKLVKGQAPAYTYHVDMETGDVLEAKTVTLVPGSQQRRKTVLHFADYRPWKGLRVPFRMTTSNEWNGKIVIQIEKAESRVDSPAAFFTIEGI